MAYRHTASLRKIENTDEVDLSTIESKVEELLRSFASTRETLAKCGASGRGSSSSKDAKAYYTSVDMMGYTMGDDTGDGEITLDEFVCLTREEKKRIPRHKLMKLKESARAKGACVICFEKGHQAKDCSQKMPEEEFKRRHCRKDITGSTNTTTFF